jgi:rod shape-determining protein MreC
VRTTDPRIVLPTAPGGRAKLVLAGTLGGCLLLMSAQARRTAMGPSLLESIGLWLASPVVRGTHAASGAGRELAGGVASYFAARAENGALHGKVDRLERELMTLRAQAEQVDRYRELLRCRAELPGARMAAPIVSVERRGAYRRALLDAGSADGVRAGSPLAVPEGLVGRIVTVGGRLSKAILVTDADCAVGAQVRRTGEQGVARGQGDDILMEYLTTLSPIQKGDIIETAGIDGFYPRGIPIGRVVEISRGKSLFLSVRVKPAAPLSRLGDVLILEPSPAQGSPP